jgi:hypothetical protein
MLKSVFRKLRLSPGGRTRKGAKRRAVPRQKSATIELPGHQRRSKNDPAGYLAVTAVVKNEARHLKEWLEFHRLVGVEHVFLYDDCSNDDTDRVVAPYVGLGFVTLIPWAPFDIANSFQHQAYAHALCRFGPGWRWMAMIDADEFLFPVEADSLPTVLRSFEDLSAIVVPWHTFGFSGHKTPPDGLVIENYTQRSPFPPSDRLLARWKSIVYPAKVGGIESAHSFEVEGGAFHETRRPSRPKIDPSLFCSNALRLNHYYTRSQQEFEERSRYGFGGQSVAKIRRDAAKVIEANTVCDTTIHRFLPSLRAALSAD